MYKSKDLGLGSVRPVERQTLGDKIYESLRQAIIQGNLEPGQRVTERQLAQQMNVSTTPVREAFRRLAALGLISIIPWSGAVIEGISQKDIVHVSQCREALEGLACRLSASRLDEQGLTRLRDLVGGIKDNPDMEVVGEIDQSIHDLVMEYSGNPRLIAMLAGINEIARLYLDLAKIDVARAAEMYREHVQILAALADRDEDRAETAMRNHISKSFEFAQWRLLNVARTEKRPFEKGGEEQA